LPGCKCQVQMPQLHLCPLGVCRIFGATRRGERHALGAAPHGFEEQTSWALAADDHTSSVTQQDLPGRPKSDEGDGAKKGTHCDFTEEGANLGRFWPTLARCSAGFLRRGQAQATFRLSFLPSSVSTLLPCLVHLVR
jgi:hypothetical protein